MRKRVYECRARLCKGAELSVEITAELDNNDTIKQVEEEIKVIAAEYFSTENRTFTPTDIKLKLLKKSGKKKSAADEIAEWLDK